MRKGAGRDLGFGSCHPTCQLPGPNLPIPLTVSSHFHPHSTLPDDLPLPLALTYLSKWREQNWSRRKGADLPVGTASQRPNGTLWMHHLHLQLVLTALWQTAPVQEAHDHWVECTELCSTVRYKIERLYF